MQKASKSSKNSAAENIETDAVKLWGGNRQEWVQHIGKNLYENMKHNANIASRGHSRAHAKAVAESTEVLRASKAGIADRLAANGAMEKLTARQKETIEGLAAEVCIRNRFLNTMSAAPLRPSLYSLLRRTTHAHRMI
eukprot:SAG31_NODE_4912_length_2871_cov_2.282468_1_plen_138_part_00